MISLLALLIHKKVFMADSYLVPGNYSIYIMRNFVCDKIYEAGFGFYRVFEVGL